MLPKSRTSLPTTIVLVSMLSLASQSCEATANLKYAYADDLTPETLAALEAEDKRLIDEYHQHDICNKHGDRLECYNLILYPPGAAFQRQAERDRLAKISPSKAIE